MHLARTKSKISTVFIRTQDGRINLVSCSSNFSFSQKSLPEIGLSCPVGTAAHEIVNGIIKEFKGPVPIERWIKPGYINGGHHILKEHSLFINGQVLTLLEIEDYGDKSM